jgi:ATP synthase protein I
MDEMNPDPETDKKSGKQRWVEVERYIQLGVVLPAAVFIGWILGSLLDRWLGTHWIYMAGVLLGVVAGFVQLFRAALKPPSDE